MSLLTDIRADTSTLIADWSDSVTFKKATHVVSTAGEVVETWSTALVTAADIQEVDPPRRRAAIEVGGLAFVPERQVFLRHGVDVREGYKFDSDGFTFHVGAVIRDEDKVVVLASRKTRAAES